MAKLFFANLILLADDDDVQAQIYAKVTGLPVEVVRGSPSMHQDYDKKYGKGKWIDPAVLETFMNSVRDTTLLNIAETIIRKLQMYQKHKKRLYSFDKLRSAVQRMLIPQTFDYLQTNLLGFPLHNKVWTTGMDVNRPYTRDDAFLSASSVFQCNYVRLVPRAIIPWLESEFVSKMVRMTLLKIAIQSAASQEDEGFFLFVFNRGQLSSHPDDEKIKELIALQGYYGLKLLGTLKKEGQPYRGNFNVVMSAIRSDGRAIRFASADLIRYHPELMEMAIRQRFPDFRHGQSLTYAEFQEFMPYEESSDDQYSADEASEDESV
jgi:hypothetical protein